jgi:hypothetical protein
MTAKPDITVTLIGHREGPLAVPALASMRDMVDAARAAGLAVEARAVLDRADELTRHTVATRGTWLDAVQEVSAGDAGLARNAGVAAAAGEFLAFLDGDDLWGTDWLRLAHAAATKPGAANEAAWHPAYLYYFVEDDFDRHSLTRTPHPDVRSFYLVHHSSEALDFDRDVLFLNNVWTANVFAKRTTHIRFPYALDDKAAGLGVEDWSWNIQTLWSGVPHLIVPDTVHLIRVKDAGSRGRQNIAEGIMPWLPDDVWPAALSSRPEAPTAPLRPKAGEPC